jgi:hypothetical protein
MCRCVPMRRCTRHSMLKVRDNWMADGIVCFLPPSHGGLVFYHCYRIPQKSQLRENEWWQDHDASSPKSDRKQEVGTGYKTPRFPQSHPVTNFPQQGSFSDRFNNLPKQCHQLGTKCSKTCACGWHFTFRPQDWPQVTRLARQAPLPEPPHWPSS